MTDTKPKTQAELQARVLDVLRREWRDVYIDDDGDYRWMRGSDSVKGYLSPAGVAYGISIDDSRALFGTAELDALAEASRLLRDGVAKPSRVDRALEVLRAAGYSDAHAVRSKVYLGKDDTTYLSCATSDGYGFESDYGVSLGPVKFGAIAAALEILNAPGDE